MSSQCNALVVLGDGRLGHHMVQSMARINDEKKMVQRLVILVDKKFENDMQDVHGQTVRIESIDFSRIQQNPQDLQRLIQEHKINWLALVPFGDTFQPQMVPNILEAYKNSRGENVVMLSHIIPEEGTDQRPLSALQQAENQLRQQFPQSNCVLRTSLPLQALDFFAEDVRDRKTWRMPIAEGRFAPPCVRDDVAPCLLTILREQHLNDKYKNQTFTLTNFDLINGDILAQMTHSAFREEVRFKDIQVDEARKVIEERKRKYDRDVQDHAEPLKLNLLSNWELEAMVSMFELIRQGKYDLVTDHVQQISGNSPMAIADYLQAHEEYFRPGGRRE